MDVRYATDPVAARDDGTEPLPLTSDDALRTDYGAVYEAGRGDLVHGDANYSFIWFMTGENYRFDGMDPVPMADIR